MQIKRTPINSYITFTLLVTFVAVCSSLPQPNAHKKVVVIEPSDEANTISKSEVGASWGGYSASAGLGGGPNGGGLHAEAGGPGLGAAAGLGGGPSGGHAGAGAHASAGGAGGAGVHYGTSGTGAGAGQPGFFDNIFNIPISVLSAVNKYLNQKGTSTVTTGQHLPKHHHPHHYAPQTTDQANPPHPSLPAEIPVSGSESHANAAASASASAGGAVQSGSDSASITYVKRRPANYDNVFDIPISALKSVNQLLNG